MVWGGQRLGKELGKALPDGAAYGESWEVSDHATHASLVAAGPQAGLSLRHLMQQEHDKLLGPVGESHAVFPWLVKFLDARDWLSVQVHPDDAAAARLWPGERGKTEAWFVLDAAAGSRIYAGLLPGVDEARLRAALGNGTVADCLHQFEPQPGDCLFLPAGTVHAVGGGVLMAEVQQTSDATFRLHDWDRRDAQGRSRPLHVEQSMACIDWRRGPVYPVRTPGFHVQPGAGDMARHLRQPLVHCPFFTLEYLCDREPFACGGNGRLQLLVAVHGRGRLAHAAGEDEIALGQAWVLPAAAPRVWCRPEPTLAVLLCTLPNNN